MCVCFKTKQKNPALSRVYIKMRTTAEHARALKFLTFYQAKVRLFLRKLKNNRWLLSWCVVCLCLCINKSSINLKLSYESNSWRAALPTRSCCMPFRGDNFKLFTECSFFACVFLLLLFHIYDSFVNLFDQCVCVLNFYFLIPLRCYISSIYLLILLHLV